MINKTKPTKQNQQCRNGKWTTQNLKQYEKAKIPRCSIYKTKQLQHMTDNTKQRTIQQK